MPHRNHRRALLAATAAAIVVLPRTAPAETDVWIGPSGNWTTSTNWSLGHPPTQFDAAALIQSDATDRTVTLNTSPTAPATVAALTVDATGAGRMTLSAQSTLAVREDLLIGLNGFGRYSTTNPVANLVAGNLLLAASPGSTGEYFALHPAYLSAANIYVGGSPTAPGGAGRLAVGGDIVTSTLKIWDTPGTGVTFAGGFAVHGATLSATTLDTSGNPSRFSFASGTLNITGPAGLDTATLGPAVPVDIYRHLTVANTLRFSPTTTLTLAGGVLTAGALDRSANPAGFVWNSGAVAITAPAGLTPAPANLGPAVSLTNDKSLRVTNTLSLPAGTSVAVTGTGWLDVGALDTAGDPSRLSWSSGNLVVRGPAGLNLASLGPAVSITTSKYLSVTNALTIPAGASLALAGGTAYTGTLDTANDPSRFSWSAGRLAVTGPAGLNLAAIGPAVSLPANKELLVSSALTVPAATSLTISGGTASAGSLTLNSASLSVTAGSFHAGSSATLDAATLSVTGGSLSAGSLYLGYAATSTASQSAGTITLASTSGSPFATTSLALAHLPGSSAHYSLAGGNLYLAGSNNATYVGYQGAATFTHTGGTHSGTFGNSVDLYLAHLPNSSGAYDLSGPSAVLKVRNLYVGNAGAGSFTQSAGSASAAALVIGNSTASAGSFSLAGGTFTASAATVGSATILGSLAVTGGTLSLATLRIGAATNARVTLAGGTLAVATLSATPGHFSWTAGTLAVNAPSLTLSPTGAFGPDLTLNPGMTLAAPAAITVASAAALTLNGGSLAATSLTVNAGGLVTLAPAPAPALPRTLSLTSLGLAANATLDLADGALLLDYSAAPASPLVLGHSHPNIQVTPAALARLTTLRPAAVPEPTPALTASAVACLIAPRRRSRPPHRTT